ncbi:DUF7344 domain-containing protein [Natrarchaeobius chitinivorans]|uniref:ArsR family transcriptional regulator n=1 Tax=Natrarchaeobius chitinivorans TaxID=1679083 RepID=A0A3N6LMT6_NATCH|nr:ArsR family transcriptional regulator [Natrarchaeobius chitinivorans]RQG90508.1 ArsR family transcriptional regulator [Natrarchaeobius chitinivorans]
MDSHDSRVVRALSDPTNRIVLDVLSEADGSVSATVIAEELVARDGSVCQADDSDARLEGSLLSLHHDHLPRLDELGLVDYDADENLVTEGTTTGGDSEWEKIEVGDDLLAGVSAFAGDEIAVLEGRDAVYEYGRELADRTEDELFLIYTSEELLDADCLPNAENALQRGVDFHAGAKNASVREFFHHHLPEATIWEPQLDWMNDRSTSPTVSRLIVSDRNRVVVGIWRETAGTKREIGMVGEGEDNPLVVLVRELLGSRLDHLDYQSDSFLGHLPFET